MGNYFCSAYGNGYFTFNVDSYETFIHDIIPQFLTIDSNYVWRGMMDPAWDLHSSLSRQLAKMPIPISSTNHDWKIAATQATIQQLLYYIENLRGLTKLEPAIGELYACLNDELRKKQISFLDTLDNLSSYQKIIIELFAIGQHHKMLTPFLDWTTTPLIALYFAFEEIDPQRPNGVGDRVIYALNRKKIEEECPLGHRPSDDWVIFTNSMANDNNRIIGQNGLFTYIPASEPLDRWVVGRPNFVGSQEPVLIRFLIQNKDREKCMKELSFTGIDARSVYPDREGAALKANYYLKLKFKIT
jgi:hypothetical protein